MFVRPLRRVSGIAWPRCYLQIGRRLAPERRHLPPRRWLSATKWRGTRRLDGGMTAPVEGYIEELERLAAGGSGDRAEAAEQLSQELTAIQSIYTDGTLKVAASPENGETRLELTTNPELRGKSECVRLMLHLPPGYPKSASAPRIELLNQYIGAFLVTDDLREYAERIYGSEVSGAPYVWEPGNPMLFEGIESVQEHIRSWHDKKAARQERQKGQDKPKTQGPEKRAPAAQQDSTKAERAEPTRFREHEQLIGRLVRGELLYERKSEFLGHAARIDRPEDVPVLLNHIVESDKRVARATHPIINAWVCRTPDGVFHHDCDDDGETAAGGRLAHLLSMLNVENVLVVVTRWFGGVQLGPDRFKQINRAARDALEKSGALAANAGASGARARR